MNKFIVGACAGVLSLAASQYASAQPTTSAKPAAKKATAKKKAAKKGAAAKEAAAKPEGVLWKCELGNEMYIAGDMTRDQVVTMHWKGRNYQLPRQLTRTGADRYFDQRTGMDLVVIPAKAMLFDRNEGHRLADECQTRKWRGRTGPDARRRPARAGRPAADDAGQRRTGARSGPHA